MSKKNLAKMKREEPKINVAFLGYVSGEFISLQITDNYLHKIWHLCVCAFVHHMALFYLYLFSRALRNTYVHTCRNMCSGLIFRVYTRFVVVIRHTHIIKVSLLLLLFSAQTRSTKRQKENCQDRLFILELVDRP